MLKFNIWLFTGAGACVDGVAEAAGRATEEIRDEGDVVRGAGTQRGYSMAEVGRLRGHAPASAAAAAAAAASRVSAVAPAHTREREHTRTPARTS